MSGCEILRVDPEHPDPDALARAAKLFEAGRLLIYPTDTLYAVGGRAASPVAGRAVRLAKRRPESKPLPLVAADVEQARALCALWPEAAERLAAALWPGPLTLVLAARPEVPAEITSGTATVAVRVPRLPLTRWLCAGGAIVSTSANVANGPAPLTCAEAVAAVGASAALALDAGPGRPLASTIVDLTGKEPRLARAGAVPWPDVLASLR